VVGGGLCGGRGGAVVGGGFGCCGVEGRVGGVVAMHGGRGLGVRGGGGWGGCAAVGWREGR